MYIVVYGRVVRKSVSSLVVVAEPVNSRIARITAEDVDWLCAIYFVTNKGTDAG